MSRSTAKAARLPLGEVEPRPTFRRERAALKRGVWPVAAHYGGIDIDTDAAAQELMPDLLSP